MDAAASAFPSLFRAARERQLKPWEAAHPGSPRKAAQYLHAPRPAAGVPTPFPTTSQGEGGVLILTPQ